MPRTDLHPSGTESDALSFPDANADANANTDPNSDSLTRNVHPIVPDGDCTVV
jgi:hypothetical protein